MFTVIALIVVVEVFDSARMVVTLLDFPVPFGSLLLTGLPEDLVILDFKLFDPPLLLLYRLLPRIDLLLRQLRPLCGLPADRPTGLAL